MGTMKSLTLSLLCICAWISLESVVVHAKVVEHETPRSDTIWPMGQRYGDLAFTHPPRFVQQPAGEVAYKSEDKKRIELLCEAKADPAPTYVWHKNGIEIDPLDASYQRDVGTGSLYIDAPNNDHEGVYQCFASNSFGTALSTKSVLKRAILLPFDSVENIPVLTPMVGDSLRLPCNPPDSYPAGDIYWGQNNGFERIQTDDRIMMDYTGNFYFTHVIMDDEMNPGLAYSCMRKNLVIRSVVMGSDTIVKPQQSTEGNLYFANVIMDDELGGIPYLCLIYNPILRGLVTGDDKNVRPQPSPGVTNTFREPSLMWKSETPTVAIVGDDKSMKCIFSGYPTPRVSWTRHDRHGNAISMPAGVTETNGAEITIRSVDFGDEGTYRCTASGDYSDPTTESFQLHVESAPQWQTIPESINSAVDESVSFHCSALGNPAPAIVWSINGEPYTDSDNRHMAPNGTTISYTMLRESDIQVLQCNTSNKHGYNFANAFLNVAADPPTFLEVPDPSTIVAEHQSVNLTCRAYGAPNPKILWFKVEGANNEDEIEIPLDGGKFSVQHNGYLTIENIAHEDEGTYKCNATNKFGSKDATGVVYVRDATRITRGPESLTVRAGTSVSFECDATTDQFEMSKLTIKWLHNGNEINYMRETHLHKNLEDSSLQIVVSKVSDTGIYTCVANNTLDAATSEAELVVQDVPSPPVNLGFTTCGQRFAGVTWDAGADNNAPIIEYIPFYRTSFDAENEWTEEDAVAYQEPVRDNPPQGDYTFKLSPWANFTFHVKARNEIGDSEPSQNTIACETGEDVPYDNPNDVCTDLEDPSKLIITWEHMPKIKQNGEGFYYMLHYRRNKPGYPEETLKISDWRAERAEISIDHPDEPFQQYSIYIRTGNNRGQSHERLTEPVLGFTGEDVPLDMPENFDIDPDTLNATSVTFIWDRVDEGPERIQGHFKGYQIHFWRANDPDDIRVHDVVMADVFTCVDDNSRNRRRRSLHLSHLTKRHSKRAAGDQADAHVGNLWPDSDVEAGIMAVNSGKLGTLSPPISFRSPEGPPGVAGSFLVSETGSHHLIVSWTPPLEPNGQVVGYVIGYHADDMSPVYMDFIRDIPPNKFSQKIRELDEVTRYWITLWGITGGGQGLPFKIEQTTLATGVPDTPGFHHIDHGENHLNVSFEPTAEGPKVNPGSHFIVEYRPKGSEDDWESATPEGDNNWVNITDLVPGQVYEMRVVALNGVGDRTESDVKLVVFGPKQEPQVQTIATAGWFIGMMIAIAFLLLILIIVCLIKRNRGGKYPVHEKEKLRGKPDNDDDEAGFGEYNKTPYTPLTSDDPYYPASKKPSGSLDSAKKPLGDSDNVSDDSSMAEYADLEPNKFNEDGSFIGQYGGKKDKEPNALQTFV